MSCDNVFKDICHIHARLFDHRSTFQGHINFFAKEFEEKRGDREKTRLDHIREAVSQASDHTLPTVQSHCAGQLSLITQRIKQATERCQQVAEQEKEEQTDSDFLRGQREARQEAMRVFMEEQCVRSAGVDQQFEDNVRAVNRAHHQIGEQLSQGIPLTTHTYHHFMALGRDIS